MSQYKPYPKYKPSGGDWIGDVPEGLEMQVLIVRSAPIEQYRKVVKSLLDVGINASDIGVLTLEASKTDIVNIANVEVFTYNTSKLKRSSLSKAMYQKIIKRKFDKVIIIYANYLGEGYLEIKKLALSFNMPLIEEWNLEGYVYTHKREDFKKLALKFKIDFILYFFVWLYLFIINLFLPKKLCNENRN